MLRHKPKFTYTGLSVVLSNPSRFDSIRLLSATGGQMFNDFCLRPEMNILQCDIRLTDDTTPFLDGTKCLLLLGEYAMHKYCPDTSNNTLNEMRGSPLISKEGIPAIASFFPQDCVDIKSYEQTFNTESKDYSGEESNDQDGDDSEGNEKSLSPTKKSNYAFWLRSDCKKVKRILFSGVPPRTEPTYRIYPNSLEVIEALSKVKNQFLYFDIETDYEEQNLLCFSFNFSGSNTVYSVPCLDHNYKWAYSSLHIVLRALSVAIRDNVLVAHNGASFDFLVLGYKYSIPVSRCYDTMIAMHRCYPDIEKSLGHGMSLWTWERFHKDTDSKSYMTSQNMMDKLKYCGKDVWGMKLIHESITEYAKTVPGLQESIQYGMDSIRPYLICTLMGIKYNQEKVNALINENDRLMMQYIRIIELLIGKMGMDICRSSVKGKAKSFPGSNTQCCNYFHEQLGYAVQMRSELTQKPSLAAKQMYKLRLKYPDNSVISLVLAYRGLQKETSKLKFVPWKDNDNQISKIQTDSPQISLIGYTNNLLGR